MRIVSKSLLSSDLHCYYSTQEATIAQLRNSDIATNATSKETSIVYFSVSHCSGSKAFTNILVSWLCIKHTFLKERNDTAVLK